MQKQNNMKPAFPTLSIIFFLCSTSTLLWAEQQGPKEVETWFERLAQVKRPEQTTKLHFYFHDMITGKIKTSSVVAYANTTFSSPTFFGMFAAADDPLTVGPGFNSKRVGYLKGFYGAASLEEVDLVMAFTFVFTDGVYNGSSLSVLGHNPHPTHKYRELPVVGGSGMFRLARGVATFQTYFYDVVSGNATVEIDIVVLHY